MQFGAPIFCVVLLTFALTPPLSSAESEFQVQISEVHSHPEAGGREFIELFNLGSDSVQLAGWNITDNINNFVFPEWELVSGGRVVVWGGGNESSLGPVWKNNVWNNGGDPVVLRDYNGNVVDSIHYGTPELPAPSQGLSLHLEDGWHESEPTPGQDWQSTQGSASVEVYDVAPTVDWVSMPAEIHPGQNITIEVEFEDGNGDPLQWMVTPDGASAQSGNKSGLSSFTAVAPDQPGAWTWTAWVTSTQHNVSNTLELQIGSGSFAIAMPESGISFPNLEPGHQQVTANAPFTIIYHGNTSAVPYIDISPFTSTKANLTVDGNLRLLIELADGTQQIVNYDGPVQELPFLSTGQQYDVWLIIEQVPNPLPAGVYRSSFTVVP